ERSSDAAAFWELLRPGLEIRHLNRLAIEYRGPAHRAANRGNSEPQTGGERPMVGHQAQDVTVEELDVRVSVSAQPGGTRGHRIQYGVQVGRRTRDDPEDLA